MDFEILMSCMNQKDTSIAEASNIHDPVLIINQCDRKETVEEENIRMISTTDRGLSKSRNLAIQNARGDICLLSDDDERFENGIKEAVLSYYRQLDADIIVFDLSNFHKKIKRTVHRLTWAERLRVTSVQITFRLTSVKGVVSFDEHLGSGTGNGSGEDTKFVMDAHKKGLKIFYVPMDIGFLKGINQEKSAWFFGYDKKYFFSSAKVSRYQLGFPLAFGLMMRFLICKRALYRSSIPMRQAFYATMKGLFTKDINQKYE